MTYRGDERYVIHMTTNTDWHTDTDPRSALRIRLNCPAGHEVLTAPLSSRLGQRLAAGDFADEMECGVTSCRHNPYRVAR